MSDTPTNAAVAGDFGHPLPADGSCPRCAEKGQTADCWVCDGTGRIAAVDPPSDTALTCHDRGECCCPNHGLPITNDVADVWGDR